MHLDLGGAICLFVGGGVIGLIVFWIYSKGYNEGRTRPDYDDESDWQM
jgi:hypothetical protein